MATKKAKKSVKTGDPKSEPVASVGEQAPVAETSPAQEIASETAAPAVAKPAAEVVDPIGDTTDGEAKAYLGEEAPAETEVEEGSSAEDAPEEGPEETAEIEAGPGAEAAADADSAKADDDSNISDEEEEAEFAAKPRPPAKLERLQKILSQAGVASRRKAEEMIEQGRVQVNGTVVTELGTKADGGRDHIRVDGKLLHGAERLRYFVLNKPKGFVTTVKDPEGRPTVMQFFEKMRERLYPVGRLDYMSEGLLLVTNDGELANKLTKAGSGVEKVYLVKVAGQPTESELEILRGGVSIERGKPGSPQVRTSPARIRQVRQGDNPWYEVVLIEGRNRELRKMFSAVGHFVEKIRRVGYGPLVLDQEPGNLRELDASELAALRLAAEGKLRTPKSKDVRRRNLADAQLPTVRPKPSRLHSAKPYDPLKPAKPFDPRNLDESPATASEPGEFRPKRAFGADKPFRATRPAAGGFRPAQGRSATVPGPGKFGPRKFGQAGTGAARPAWKKDDRPSRPPARSAAGLGEGTRPSARKPYGDRPATGRSYGDGPASGPAAGRTYGAKPAGRTFGGKPTGRPFAGKPGSGKPFGERPFAGKPGFDRSDREKPGRSERPSFKRPAAPAPRREPAVPTEDFTPFQPGGLRIDPIEPSSAGTRSPDTRRPETRRPGGRGKSSARPSAGRPPFGRTSSDRPRTGKPSFERPEGDRPRFERSRFDRSSPGRSSGPGRSEAGDPSSHARPPRSEGGLARPFTTSSGKPRAGGARPSSKPYRPGTGGHSKPKPGGFSKSGPKSSGFRGKPGGAKRSGPHSGGKKRG